MYPIVNGKYKKNMDPPPFKEWLFFCADRVGKEGPNKKYIYRGCSFGCSINPIKLYSILDKRNEGYLAIEGSINL